LIKNNNLILTINYKNKKKELKMYNILKLMELNFSVKELSNHRLDISKDIEKEKKK
jgi:hypothetical protein